MNFSKDPNGTITMSQSEIYILTKDEDENGRKQEWYYRSVIGYEYNSLIQSTRDLIPLKNIMLEVSGVFGMKCDLYNSYTTTFEDNKGAIKLSKYPKCRPQTKHVSIKWHHFREHIKKIISKIVYIETNEHQSKIMKKPLSKPQFEYLRKYIMVW